MKIKYVLSLALLLVFFADVFVFKTYTDPPALGVQIIFLLGRVMCIVLLADGFYKNLMSEVVWLD